MLLTKFIAWSFFYPLARGAWIVGVAIGVLLCLCARASAHRLPSAFWLLPAMFALSVFAAVARVPLAAIDPILAGPRYFFYPYIFLWWFALGVAVRASHWGVVAFISALLASGIYVSSKNYVRTSDAMDWREQATACANQNGRMEIPILSDGRRESAWHLALNGSECRHLIARSVFARSAATLPAALK